MTFDDALIVGPGGNSVKMAPYTFPAGGNFPGVVFKCE